MGVDYGEDFLQRIVAVHWRKGGAQQGAVFVIADAVGGIYYMKFKNKNDTPEFITVQAAFSTSEGSLEFRGGAYAVVGAGPKLGYKGKPVFILIGWDALDADFNYSRTYIYTSNDGLAWHRTLTGVADPFDGKQTSAQAVVWDVPSKRFVVSVLTIKDLQNLIEIQRSGGLQQTVKVGS